jgi:serine/threonine-protein kinase HipA
LRNHGFLYDGAGWTLSPAYDLNPTPVDIKPRILSTAIDEEDTRASLKLAFSVIDYFELEMKVAQKIVAEVARAVSHWRDVARACGIKNHEVERMASAFEHDDAKAALELTR